MSRTHLHAQFALPARLALLGAPAILIAILALLLGTRPAQAGGLVGTGTPGSCTTAALANAVSGGGTVSFNCGSAPHTIIADTTLVTSTLNIDGGGRVILDGEDLRQIFYVVGGGNLSLNNITLTRGNGSLGGALYVDTNGEATLRNVTLQLSRAQGATGSGGAAYVKGELILLESRVISNTADLRGGGIFNAGGTVGIRGSAIHNNGAFDTTAAQVGQGGGLFMQSGTLAVLRSSFSSNAAELRGGGLMIQSGSALLERVSVLGNSSNHADPTDGGGIFTQGGTLDIVSSTVAGNRADTGGGVYNTAATVTLKNTIIADNTVPLSADPNSVLDCDGPTLLSQGFNIIGDGSCLFAPAASDRKNTPPQLSPIATVGALRYAAPAVGSPAIDTGSNDASCNTADVRGTLPLGVCDVGAIEFARFAYLPMVRK